MESGWLEAIMFATTLYANLTVRLPLLVIVRIHLSTQPMCHSGIFLMAEVVASLNHKFKLTTFNQTSCYISVEILPNNDFSKQKSTNYA